MAKEPKPNDDLRAAANILAEEKSADILFINAEVDKLLDWAVYNEGGKRNPHPNLILILVTEGGIADVAYRTMRLLQTRYNHITVVVPGWCKSAGTLMCVGANEIQISEVGELGPLDVQLRRPDQLNEMSSGLAIDTAVEKLQHEAFKLFMGFVREMAATEVRFSLRTAAKVSKDIAIGLFSPIFEKLDPIAIGEDFRSYKIAEAYAERLNLQPQNLRRDREFDGLRAILEGYPSHGFVIDVDEARTIFVRVKRTELSVRKVVAAIGAAAIVPIDRDKDINRRVEFLNDPRPPETNAASATESGAGSDAGGDGGNPTSGTVAEDVSGDSSARDGGTPLPAKKTRRKRTK